MRSSNPTLQENTFADLRSKGADHAMTVSGTVGKSIVLLLLLLLTSGWTWMRFVNSGGNPESVTTMIWVGALGGFGVAIVTIFKKEWAAFTAPAYALLEGLFVGGLSSMMELQFPGIVIQAAMLTFGTLGAMLLAYQAGLVRATEKFKLGLFAATGGIAIVYFISIVLSFFGISVPFIFGSGLTGILFSLFVVVIAALNLVIDFDFIEKGAQYRVPKYMEWYGAFALMVTLIWLYIEFLRLLAKVRSR